MKDSNGPPRLRPSCVLLAPLLAGIGACGTSPSPDPTKARVAGPDAGALDAGDDRAAASVDDFVPPPLVRYVDPIIGTGGLAYGVGSTYPGPAMPHGMIHPGPDTSTGGSSIGFAHCSGYFYPDDEIDGFSHTRLEGTGVADLGNISLMPLTRVTSAGLAGEAYRSRFAHATEEAKAGYYAVTLDTTGVRVEITSSYHAALHRWTYPSGSAPFVLLDLAHSLGQSGHVESATATADADGTVHGFVHFMGGMSGRDGGNKPYFALRVDRPITNVQTWTAGALSDGSSVSAADGKLVLALGGGPGVVRLKIALSYVSESEARKNLDAEAPAWDFDGMRAAAEAAWEKVLGKIRIAGGTEAERTMFYSSLYRSFLMPTLYTDVSGQYAGLDRAAHAADGFTYFSDFSLWDTFRTVHPLMNLIAPDRARDFALSMNRMAAEGGSYDRWPLGTSYTGTMTGDWAANVIAESYLKGITDVEPDFALTHLMAQADAPLPPGSRGPGRNHIDQFISLGWVADAASVTVEYAYNDWALAHFARALGKTADADRYAKRAGNYKNSWDPATGFMRARAADGSFAASFDPTAQTKGYVEGDAWQWSWMAPQDPDGLIALHGSPEAFVAKLGEFFEKSKLFSAQSTQDRLLLPDPYYWHGNEPDLHAAYLFADAGRPDLAQKWARAALDAAYGPGPDGLPGNDDGGTMSAWHVFTALGVYPIAGGVEYWLGSPRFPHARIQRAEGDIEIRAPGASASRIYVSGVRVNGKAVTGRLNHDAIRRGAVVEFAMQADPPAP
jgi:predicted alpha-1,2-mannosidase